jgi:hypothetical protein
MPAFLTLPAHLPVAELEQRYRAARDPVARSHWQIIWLLSCGHRAAAVATVTGYSVNWVREIARRYREAGPKGLGIGVTIILAVRRCWMRLDGRPSTRHSPVRPPGSGSRPSCSRR